MNGETVFLTPEGRDQIEGELQHLLEVRRPEVAHLIKDAKEAGDISENAAYDEAKEQQAFVEGRIQHLRDILKRAEVIKEVESNGRVIIGSSVTVAEDGAEPETFRIVGSAEADPAKGMISNESPLGQALLGQEVGATAEIDTPGGRLVFQVLEVD